MKTFKVGDKVRIKDMEVSSSSMDGIVFVSEMRSYIGKEATIEAMYRNAYIYLDIDKNLCSWSAEWLEPVEDECKHENREFFHENAPAYCPDCGSYVDGEKPIVTISGNVDIEKLRDYAQLIETGYIPINDGSIPSINETWQPTPQLRWKRIVDNNQLQQLWISNTGEEEWRQVEYVD